MPGQAAAHGRHGCFPADRLPRPDRLQTDGGRRDPDDLPAAAVYHADLRPGRFRKRICLHDDLDVLADHGHRVHHPDGIHLRGDRTEITCAAAGDRAAGDEPCRFFTLLYCPWGDNNPETGMIISFTSENGDIQLDSVKNISSTLPDSLIYGNNELYIVMIISLNQLSSQKKEEIKRYLLQIQVDYYHF